MSEQDTTNKRKGCITLVVVWLLASAWCYSAMTPTPYRILEVTHYLDEAGRLSDTMTVEVEGDMTECSRTFEGSPQPIARQSTDDQLNLRVGHRLECPDARITVVSAGALGYEAVE